MRRTLEACLKMCAETAPAHSLHKTTRKRHEVRARWCVWYVLSEIGWSSTQIGSRYGMDHTTVLHGLGKFRDALATKQRWAIALLDAATQTTPQ